MSIETEQLTDIDDLRHEIDRLDAEILAAVKRRTEVSQAIGKARMASGGTRLVHSREMTARTWPCCCSGWAADGSVTDPAGAECERSAPSVNAGRNPGDFSTLVSL